METPLSSWILFPADGRGIVEDNFLIKVSLFRTILPNDAVVELRGADSYEFKAYLSNGVEYPISILQRKEKENNDNLLEEIIFTISLDTAGMPAGASFLSLKSNLNTEKAIIDTLTISIPDINQETGEFVEATEVERPIYLERGNLNDGKIDVSLTRTNATITPDVILWLSILNSTEAISFNKYYEFMNEAICEDGAENNEMYNSLKGRRFLPFNDTDAYRKVKVLTEAFLLQSCQVPLNERQFDQLDINRLEELYTIEGGLNISALQQTWKDIYLKDVEGGGNNTITIPYLNIVRNKLSDIGIRVNSGADIIRAFEDANACHGILESKLTNPCFFELMWNYWQEEGMLVQSMNAISLRFQNVRRGQKDPLAHMEIGPLRALNNLMWGYIQDEQHRLTVKRRAYEYDHHYGISLQGKAIKDWRPADSRSKFLEAFHTLLYMCTKFFEQDDDATVLADGFPIRNALREVHFILSEGAHNQYGDLPSTSRIEMLMQQWFLSRPEFREFLPTREMVAYPEPWMDRVSTMNQLQNWTDVSPIHFNHLAVFGEQLLLSIRFGAWSQGADGRTAANWARFWRPQIQGYIHAYRAATGVDLVEKSLRTGKLNFTQPSLLLKKRLQEQKRGKRSML
jgi:hypothetical protein